MDTSFSNFHINLVGSDGSQINIPGSWSFANFPGATWTGIVNIPDSFPDGKIIISASGSDFYNKELDLDGDGSSALGAESTMVVFKIDKNPPKVDLADSRGALPDGGATSGAGLTITVDDTLKPDRAPAVAVSGLDKIEIYKGADLIATDETDYPERHTYTLDELGLTDPEEGSYSAKAFDKAGNIASVDFKGIYLVAVV